MPIRLLGTKEKQSAEIVPAGRWGVDFSPDIVGTEKITSATVVVLDSTGTNVTTALTSGTPSISADGHQVTMAFKGGTHGTTYKATFLATSDAGGVYEGDFEIQVFNV